MKLLTDIAIAVPIGLIYNIFFHKIGEIINSDFEYKEKIQRNLILTFISGMVGLILALTIFSNHKKYKNRAIRYGLYVGSFLLLFHTIMYNWNILANDTKLFVITIVLLLLVWYSYRSGDSEHTGNSKISSILPMSLVDYPESFKDGRHEEEDEDEDDEEIIDY